MSEIDPVDPRWILVQQVVQSAQFEKSGKLRNFLLFVSERALTEHKSEINEQEIGVHVFGRPVGYNPGDDSIVRSQARILRQKLAEYFAAAGSGLTMRIEIPKGTYVPVFKNAVVAPPSSSDLPTSLAGLMKHPVLLAGFVILVVLAAIGGLLGGYRLQHMQREDSTEDRFWSSLFGAKRSILIVPADSTLVLIQEVTGSQVSFEEYQSRQYLSDPALNRTGSPLKDADLGESRYTSMADLNLVARLMHILRPDNLNVEIRYARDLSVSDAREDNLILIGGARANPWVQLYAGRMNFTVDFDWQRKMNVVVNRVPRQGEAPIYLGDPGEPGHRVYGLIAYEPSLDGEGNTLLVAGTSSAGTEAAADFLFSNHLFGDFLRQIRKSDGPIPHFELLLTAHNLNGNVAGSTIVASRVSH